MSDSTEAGTPAPTPDSTSLEVRTRPPLPEAVALQKTVKERLKTTDVKDGKESARERVVAALVEEEIVRRTGLLTRALGKRKELSSLVDKCKPDQVTIDAEGNENAVFTKVKHQERKKALEKLGKADKAINAVLVNPSAETYTKLENEKALK